jgi:ABC-type Fe3+-hydroxamate transport system substrate-binding protein
VSILRTKGDGATMTLVADGAFGASIAAGVGLPRPPSGASVPADRTDVERRNGEYNISLEQLGLLDADHLILITRPAGTSPKEEQQLAELRTNPLWSNLRFARTGKVHVVSLDDWLQGSARAAGRVLDDLERIAASA